MKWSAVLIASLAVAVAAKPTCTTTKTKTLTRHRTSTATITQTSTATATTTSTAVLTSTDTETDTVTQTSTEVDTTTSTETDTVTQTSTETDTVTSTETDTTTSTVLTTSTAVTTSTATTTSTETDTTTKTVTTTVTSTATPTTTPFSGKGNIFVYPTAAASSKGFLISAGSWYAGGGTPATYNGTVVNANTGTFTLNTSKGNCVIQNADSSLLCASTNTKGTVFGSTADGNLTYSGTDVFYAAATASGTTAQTVYTTPSAVAINLQWSAL